MVDLTTVTGVVRVTVPLVWVANVTTEVVETVETVAVVKPVLYLVKVVTWLVV